LNIKEIKQDFLMALSGVFPSEEIKSFFTILSEKYLNLTRIETALNPQREVSKENLMKFKNAIKRLLQFEPIQYIIGETEFYGLTFIVDKNVLIPRPETEELVNWIINERINMRKEDIDLLTSNGKQQTILDIGTGSGCIGISLAHKFPKTSVSAIDISKDALKLAEQNAVNNNVSINFIEADILNLKNESRNWSFKNLEFDIIVSNPPYVREIEKSQIEPNVIKHEPALALFVKDDDPLLFYRKIAQFSQKYLKPNGSLYLEINEYLYKDLSAMLNNEGFKEIILRKDILKKDRMLKCRRDE